MLPLAQFIARQVGPPDGEAPPARRVDVRRPRRDPEPDLESAAIEYLGTLPRRRRLALALRAPSPGRQARI